MGVLTAALVFAVARPSGAWGPDGHTIVAHIAQQLLTPDVNKTFNTLLNGRELSNASDWCDDYDHHPGGEWSASLHFIDYPGQACSFTWADCPNDWCNAGAIVNYTKQVADKSLSLEKRGFALRFILHMFGDIHQPLHVASKDDQGGNRIRTGGNKFSLSSKDWLNDTATLHAQWDTDLVVQLIRDYNTTDRYGSAVQFVPTYHEWWLISNAVVPMLTSSWKSKREEWATILADPADESGYRAGLATVAEESATRGCTYAYTDETGVRVKNGNVLSRDYYVRAKPIVLEQLAKGGVRLAQVLNSVLKDGVVGPIFA